MKNSATFKLKVKWVGSNDETYEPLANMKPHEDCE